MAKIETLHDVLRELESKRLAFTSIANSSFPAMIAVVSKAIDDIQRIEEALCVEPEEYIPAIGDVFAIIDEMGIDSAPAIRNGV